ncbi:glycosyltransferase family 8 protein [Rickettsia bellii]|uniref:Lipopolysaccharide 1,2-glucosyltransferase RfaJ n=1 Tax=Rickettsia bellii (strain RML369-C) TaxID=336407 RepID=Q1RIL1_RICBR|nr:glycosyltransferase family 8 protein [Rickettsia bellii]ABE04803.1 Lipopolysaccharide 1,2-glucosyltransferase RfaJ [Rickettsia bellii RML369-C]
MFKKRSKKNIFATIKIPLLLLLILIMFIVVIGFFTSNHKMHSENYCIRDISTYSYQKLYSIMREDLFNFDSALEQLKDKPLSVKDKVKLEKICTFKIEDGKVRLEVAKGYDCLLQLYAGEDATLVEKYKAIKNGSYGLNTLYTKNAAINLAKLIISGYEKEVKEHLNIKNDSDLIKYFSGYTEDEIAVLNDLISLNIAELTARCLYRLSMIHLLGRPSLNEQDIKLDYKLAIEEIQSVIKLTGIKQDNTLDIALIINDKFARHAATVIASSLINSDINSFYKFHIVMNPNDSLTEESMEKLASMKHIRDYSIDFIPFPENVLDLNLANEKIEFSDMWPPLVMYRLYFDQVFPNLESILYLDADIIVLRDLNSFKKLDMSNYIVAGSMDTALTYCTLKVEEECNRKINNFYKNSGIVFLNLQNMREKQAKNMVLDAMHNSKCSFAYPDQDLLNIAFHNYIYPLSMRWNFYTYFIDRDNYFSYFIMHYAGKKKPWNNEEIKWTKDILEKYQEIEKYYWRYREFTPWGNKDFN